MKRMFVFLFIISTIVSKSQTEYLVTVDPSTGNFTKINSIPGVQYVYLSLNAFEEHANSFIFTGSPPSNTPEYLYSLNNSNGDIIENPACSVSIDSYLYGDSSKTLYGIVPIGVPNRLHLVSINTKIGSYASISTLNNDLAGFGGMTYNNNLNQLIIYGFDSNEVYRFYIIDGTTGNTISSNATTNNFLEFHFDNTSNQLYGFRYNSNYLFQMGTINPVNSAFSPVFNVPAGEEIIDQTSTFDEKDQQYIIPTTNNSGDWHLYFINVGTGEIVYRDPVEAVHGAADNVVEYKYDNISNILYALHWEENSMPVTFLSFTGSSDNKENILHWITTNEINSDYFNIQRSVDGINFTTIGKVNAAGNSTTEKDYSYTDANILGLNKLIVYYRLQEVDKDGAITYNEIRSIKHEVTFTANIYPNPVQSNLTLNLTSGETVNAQIEIIDNSGKVLSSTQTQIGEGSSTQNINISSLSNGVYYVRLITAEGENELKFVKGN
jgi:hypothetical protein